MSTSIIGVRLADNSFYPVFSDLKPSRKKMVLTTARDGQERAEIGICRSFGSGPDGRAETLAMLALDDLEARNQGEPDIDLSLTLDGNGKLAVSATERGTGNTQGLFVYVNDTDYDDSYQVPSSLSDYDLFEDREGTETRPRRRSLTPLWIILLLLVFGLFGWLFFHFFLRGDVVDITDVADVPRETQPERSVPAETIPEPTAPAPAPAPTPVVPTPEDQRAPAPPDTTAAAEDALPPETVPYHINWGDTLWDISERFYGTPWLFPEIADHNRIRNPDLIFADDDIEIPGRRYLER